MSRATCSSCRFYEGNECHRYPPVAALDRNRYSFVMPHQDWCGEHEPVKQEPAPVPDAWELNARVSQAADEHEGKGYGRPNLLHLGLKEWRQLQDLIQKFAVYPVKDAEQGQRRPIEFMGLYVQNRNLPEFLGVGYDARYGYAPALPYPPC